jgi:hypothetical protein
MDHPYSITIVSRDQRRTVVTFPRRPRQIQLPEGWYSSGYISRIVDGFDASRLTQVSDEDANRIQQEVLDRAEY